MSYLIQELRDVKVPDLAISYLIQKSNDFESAYTMFLEKQAIIELLMSEFSLDERNAFHYSYNSNNFEEAAALMFSTIKRIRPSADQYMSINRSINSGALMNQLDETSTNSIYLAAPEVKIHGKTVINTDRDTANSMILDWFGKKPLDPGKIQAYPLYTVTNPRDIEYNCRICMEDYQMNDKVLLLLPCNHYFHQHCIIEFFKYKNVCPIDNVEL